MSSGSLQLVSKDSLESQLTAKNLLDKEVYDRNGKKIGKVVDVILSDQTGALASAFSSDSARSSGSGSTNYSGSSTEGAEGRSAGIGGSSEVGSSGTSSAGSNYSASRTGSSYGSSGGSSSELATTAVVISQGGMFSMDKELVRVPMSQLSYDSSAKHFKLNVTDSEIKGLASNGSSSSSTTR